MLLIGKKGCHHPPLIVCFASETHLCRQLSTVAAWAAKVELLFDPCHLSPEGRYLIHLFHLAKGWRQVSWWRKKTVGKWGGSNKMVLHVLVFR